MLDFLNDKYKKQGLKKFLTTGSLFCFISDVGNLAYVNLYFLDRYINTKSLGMAFAMQGVDMHSISQYDLMTYKKLMIDSLGMMFLCFMVYHCFVYFKMARNKLWAKKYVYGYALTGTFLTVLEIPRLLQEHILWATVMLLTTVIYFYTFMGIRYFKKLEQ